MIRLTQLRDRIASRKSPADEDDWHHRRMADYGTRSPIHALLGKRRGPADKVVATPEPLL